jgi:hypothetical protein
MRLFTSILGWTTDSFADKIPRLVNGRNGFIKTLPEIKKHDLGIMVHSRRISQIPWEGVIVKKIIILLVVAATLFFVAGCGPGQPFEIEGKHIPQYGETTRLLAAR